MEFQGEAIERTIEPIAHLSLYQLVYLCNSIATSFNEPIHSSTFAPSLPKVNNQRKQENPRYSRLNLSLQFNTQGCWSKIKASALSHCRPNHASSQLNQNPYQAAPADTRKDKKQARAISKLSVSIIFPGPAKRRNKIFALSYCVFARSRRKRSAKNDF